MENKKCGFATKGSIYVLDHKPSQSIHLANIFRILGIYTCTYVCMYKYFANEKCCPFGVYLYCIGLLYPEQGTYIVLSLLQSL